MNAKLAAIKILENAKKALKEKIESLEKADGKNTAQLNEFKGIPQPPAPKAPAKAIAPTPKIPKPKMPGMGKSSEEMNKAKVDEGKTDEEKRKARLDRGNRFGARSGDSGGFLADDKGVHLNQDDNKRGTSSAGHFAREYKKDKDYSGYFGHPKLQAKAFHEKVISEQKAMPKPNLPKSERPLSSFLKKREGKVK